MALRSFFLSLSVLICIGLAFVAGFMSYPVLYPLLTPPIATESTSVLQEVIAPVADPMDMTVFWQVNEILERDFYGAKPDLQVRRQAAIDGLVDSFGDLYTRYEPPAESPASRAAICGCEGQIGVTIDQTEAGFILHPLPDLPAQKAGILDGDRLIQVDETVVTAAMSIDQLFAKVNGNPGTPVILVVQRPAADQDKVEIINFQMTRTLVIKPSMEWRLMTDEVSTSNIGYIRHFHFTDHSPEEMENALAELMAKGADRFILDLRDNGGGPVDAALKIIDMWLDEGVMLIEEDANGAEKRFEATAGQIAENAPLIIVVNHNTASASEIVAGALRDYNRATLVGAKTYGKGSVQLRHELADHSSLFVTNAVWFTPQRYQIAGIGLQPDLIVEADIDPLPLAIASVQQNVVAQR
jgi:carboxyl-terminal processing protease